MNFYKQITKFSIYLSVFLVPIFFLPTGSGRYDFAKIYLLFFLALIGFLAYLAEMVKNRKKVVFHRTAMDLPVLVFAIVSLLSAYFSVDRNVSFFGFYDRFFPSLLGIIALLIFYFLLSQNLAESRILEIEKILKLLFISTGISVLTAYGAVSGIWEKIIKLFSPTMSPTMSGQAGASLFFQPSFNLTAKSITGLAGFLMPLIFFLVVLWIQSKFVKKENIVVFLLIFLFLGILGIADLYLFWITLIIILAVFLLFAFKTKFSRSHINKLLLPMFLLVVVIFLWVFNPMQAIIRLTNGSIFLQRVNNSVYEIMPNFPESYKAAFRQFWEKPVLGSGLGNFYYSFNKYRSRELNKGFSWQIRFDRPGSHFAEIIATQGILGILSFLFLMGYFILTGWRYLKEQTSSEAKREKIKKSFQVPVLFGTLAFALLQIFYYQNFVLAFGFFLFLALATAGFKFKAKKKEFSFEKLPEAGLIFNFVLIAVFIAFIYFCFYQTKMVLAEVKFSQAAVIQKEASLEMIDFAEKLNKRQSVYYASNGRLSLDYCLKELAKPDGQRDNDKIQGLAARALQKSKTAFDLSPNLVNICENMAVIYRDMQGLAQGVEEWAKKTFEQCLILEPQNPLFYFELGRLNLDTDRGKAKEYFLEAIEKKSDYLSAHIQYALTLEREGNIKEAIGYLEIKNKEYGNVAELKFQIGRFYFNSGNYEKAIDYLKEAIVLAPNYSNAHYSLALTYKKTGRRDLALIEFKKVLELNPGNKQIEENIEELRAE